MTVYSEEEIIEKLKAACEKLNPMVRGKKSWRGGQRIWAEKHGISPQYLSEILRGTRPLPEEVVKKLNKKFRQENFWTLLPGAAMDRAFKSFKELMENVNYNDN